MRAALSHKKTCSNHNPHITSPTRARQESKNKGAEAATDDEKHEKTKRTIAHRQEESEAVGS